VSEEILTRTEILNDLAIVLKLHVQISDYVKEKLCCPPDDANSLTEELVVKRNKAGKHLKSLMDKFSFSSRLPKNDMGIMTQAIIDYLLRIQLTFAQILVIIDSLRGESFSEIYMDSLTTISAKVHEEIVTLLNMVEVLESEPESVKAGLDHIIKLERQVDEDNIIICRQISVKTSEGESGFSCYMMRKIIAELEHISDYIKECAEIIADF
jgi:hypothetical protein